MDTSFVDNTERIFDLHEFLAKACEEIELTEENIAGFLGLVSNYVISNTADELGRSDAKNLCLVKGRGFSCSAILLS